MNMERQKELKRALVKIKTEVLQVVSGELLIENSLIEGRSFRSKLLAQTGYQDRPDGGITRIVKELKAKSDVGLADIEASIENNNALVRTSIRPRRIAQIKELVKVYAGDERTPIPPPVRPVESGPDASQVVVRQKTIEVYNPTPLVAISYFEPQFGMQNTVQEEQSVASVNENIIGFASRLFDTGVHNIRSIAGNNNRNPKTGL
jgi:hypothetical protein